MTADGVQVSRNVHGVDFLGYLQEMHACMFTKAHLPEGDVLDRAIAAVVRGMKERNLSGKQRLDIYESILTGIVSLYMAKKKGKFGSWRLLEAIYYIGDSSCELATCPDESTLASMELPYVYTMFGTPVAHSVVLIDFQKKHKAIRSGTESAPSVLDRVYPNVSADDYGVLLRALAITAKAAVWRKF